MKFNLAEFREFFPEFDSVDDVVILRNFKIGKHYVTNFTDDDQLTIQLMICHLLYIQSLIQKGDVTAVVTSANEGDVSVVLAQPPRSTNFSYWLNVSPYGLQLLSLLEAMAVGGLYIGGSPEASTIRSYNGKV